MSQIIFRVWDKEEKKMYFSKKMSLKKLMVDQDGTLGMMDFENLHWSGVLGGLRFITELYSHWCDSEGTQVFEGDIIKHDEIERRVFLHKGAFGYTSSLGDFVALKDNDLPWIVVGTIHDKE